MPPQVDQAQQAAAPPPQEAMSRNEFLDRLVRRGMLVGLAGVGAAALSGKKAVSECFNNNYCSSCWAYNGCSLPEKKEIEQ